MSKHFESHEQLNKYKRDALFKKWNENVFKPLQDEICKYMNSDTFLSFEANKRELFSYYLTLSKDHNYLDVIPMFGYQPVHGQVKVNTIIIDFLFIYRPII